MPQLQTTETVLAYYEAVRTGSPDVDKLRDKWLQELHIAMEDVVYKAQETMKDVKSKQEQEGETGFKRGEKRKLYNKLVDSYRTCILLAKEISTVKKTMREK